MEAEEDPPKPGEVRPRPRAYPPSQRHKNFRDRLPSQPHLAIPSLGASIVTMAELASQNVSRSFGAFNLLAL